MKFKIQNRSCKILSIYLFKNGIYSFILFLYSFLLYDMHCMTFYEGALHMFDKICLILC